MDPDRALAVCAAMCEASCLVAKICELVGEVKENRADKRCQKLGILAQQIQTLLIQRPEALNSHGLAHQAKLCVADIHNYMATYKDGRSLLGDAVEVLWKKRYKEHVAAAEKVKERFVFGLHSLTDFRPLARPGSGLELQPQETFAIPASVTITWGDYMYSHSHGEATIDPLGSVICRKFKSDKMSVRSLEMYPALQDRAHVQQLKGLAKVDGELHVFFEDCRHHEQLDDLCASRSLPSHLTARVEIAFKIARTVAQYHKFGLVLKELVAQTST